MKTSIITILILLLTFNIVFAGDDDSKSANEALILKVTVKAESVKEGDWKTLANCAKTLLDQRINCEEALTWLEKSVSIEKNYYNLMILGDYYRINLDFTQAYNNYINAILSAQKERRQDVIPDIQWKILITMGTKNYYDFNAKHENNN